MRKIKASELIGPVKQALQEINFDTPAETMESLRRAWKTEVSEAGRGVLEDIVKNREIAAKKRLAMCQDTGMAVIFVELGQEVHIEGPIEEALNEAVRQAYEEGYLRKSVVADPLFDRKNTRDNTPAIVHFRLVPGEQLKLIVAAKGAGSENMSTVKMLTPAAGVAGLKRAVVEFVEQAGPNPCPPIVVGLGIGGDLELAALLAKRALMRKMGQRNPDPRYAKLEEELLEAINRTGVGPQGLGGINTAMDVRIEYFPTHIAELPLAINIDCHLHRHKEIVI
ncbi:MAG: fumarate hydratase [Candidatus Acetothermia bacterium]|jgi:fumarate hydratase subunit alpha|nr:fumarate hydratase [Candidatus Acetothermia bacterium]MDH7505502.1 fumarate hydratase [Candidatus Acetothermia bacterium]